MSTNLNFEDICCNIKSITLPDNWKYEIFKENITFYTIKSNENELGICVEKQIILERDMIFKCKLYNINFDIQDLSVNSKIVSLDELISVLKILNTKNICSGGPLVEEFGEITVDCADVVFQNRWRHKKCKYLIDKLSTKSKCIFCERLRTTFRMKKSRISAGKSTRLVLPSIKKKQLDQLRNRKHNTQKKILRAKHRIKCLQNQLNDAKEKLNKLSDSSVEDLIIKNKLNDSQSTLIREIVMASRYKNPKNRHYSENWMLLCLLFNIRSPGAYRFLREQELMPLPCTSTIRKHLSIVNTNCGFDLQFFDLLKRRMSKKHQNQRHGVLLFDEIQLRKGLYVNTRDLTYSGLEDMGGEAEVSENKADHGLVFFFQALADKFSQPIAVFASCNSVKGNLYLFMKVRAGILCKNFKW